MLEEAGGLFANLLEKTRWSIKRKVKIERCEEYITKEQLKAEKRKKKKGSEAEVYNKCKAK